MGIMMVQQPNQHNRTEADYRAAAQEMPPRYLGESFAVGGTDFNQEAAKLALFKDNALEFGRLSGSAEGVILNGAALKRQNEQGQNAKGGKNGKTAAKDTMNFIVLMDQLDNQIANLEGSIADREGELEARLGDAWIEIIAGKVLDPDEMPERQDGEPIPDWRARVEDKMNEKMIDPETGEIRDEYKNHPDQDVREAAKLAQAKYDLEKLNELKQNLDDPNLTDEEKQRYRAPRHEEQRDRTPNICHAPRVCLSEQLAKSRYSL